MARYRRDGTFYIKTLGGIEVPASGMPYVSFAKMIPPYVAVNRYWVHMWITGQGALPVHSKQQAIVSGRMANAPIDVDLSAWTTDGSGLAGDNGQDHANGIVGRYMPRSGGSYAAAEANWYDGDATEDAGTGLTGANVMIDDDDSSGDPDTVANQFQMSQQAKAREFLHWEGMYGLGKNAIMTSQDKIRYCSEVVKSGRISGYGCNVDQWRLIGIDTLTAGLRESSSDDDTDQAELMLFGNTTPNPDTLMAQAFYFFGEEGRVGDSTSSKFVLDDSGSPRELNAPSAIGNSILSDAQGTGGIHATDIHKWMTESISTYNSNNTEDSGATMRGSGLDDSTGLIVQTKVTLECKTLKTVNRRLYTPD
mgnify:CR=1 FL=1